MPRQGWQFLNAYPQLTESSEKKGQTNLIGDVLLARIGTFTPAVIRYEITFLSRYRLLNDYLFCKYCTELRIVNNINVL